jgi:hypothetical protein
MSPVVLAAGASIVAFWNQARGFLQKIISIFIRSEILVNQIADPFLKEIYPNCKKIGIGNSFYSKGLDFDINGSPVDFFFRNKGSYFVLYKNIYPAFLSSNSFYEVRVTYLAGLFPILEILRGIGSKMATNRSEREKFSIYKIFGEGRTNNSEPTLSKLSATASGKEDSFFGYFQTKEWVDGLGVDLNIFNFERGTTKKNFYWHETGKKIKSDVEHWLKSQAWYAERGIHWRRGCLLHGEPGSGKSKLITEICLSLDIPLRIFDISTMKNEEFINFFSSSPMGSVVLIEDIDSVFDGRENIIQKTRINDELMTFDCLINTLSGAKQTNGVYVFITTNNIDKLDPALIRSGRVDSKFEIPKLDKEGKVFIAENILKGFEHLIEGVVSDNLDSTAADFENICVELAKTEYWKDFNTK